MGRHNTRWGSNVYRVFIIGEQLRKKMHKHGQVKDRRHHLRKHKQCFVGRDVIDWLLTTGQVQSRDEAVSALQTLLQHGVFHHITNEHDFKDQNYFYRFSFDDRTYRAQAELASFYLGLDIYRRLKASKRVVLQEFYLKGALYKDAFFGCDLVDFIVVSEGEENREDVIGRLRDLLQRDVIKHVTDDYHFCDDKVIYEFSLDFEKPCSLQELGEIQAERSSTDLTDFTVSLEAGAGGSSRESASPALIRGLRKVDSASAVSTDSGVSEVSSSSPGSSPRRGVDTTAVTSHRLEQKSGSGRAVTGQELEDLLSHNNSLCLKITPDALGFGFVLHGSSPSYVQTVDPLGPAAAAGLKACQFVTRVNGQDVRTMSHRDVGLLVAQTNQLSITVLAYSSVVVRQRSLC